MDYHGYDHTIQFENEESIGHKTSTGTGIIGDEDSQISRAQWLQRNDRQSREQRGTGAPKGSPHSSQQQPEAVVLTRINSHCQVPTARNPRRAGTGMLYP
jgi:hypothetical protein